MSSGDVVCGSLFGTSNPVPMVHFPGPAGLQVGSAALILRDP